MNKLFTLLLGTVLGGGGLALAGSGANDWAYDKVAENFPALKEFEGTAFGAFAKDNWPIVAGGIAAYIAAPAMLKPLAGLAIAGVLAFKAWQHFLPNTFNSAASPNQTREATLDLPMTAEKLAATINIDDAKLEQATRLANGLNRDMANPGELATSGTGRHGIVETDTDPARTIEVEDLDLNDPRREHD